MADRILSVVIAAWQFDVIVGLASVLLPVILFIAGFFAVALILRAMGCFVGGMFRSLERCLSARFRSPARGDP